MSVHWGGKGPGHVSRWPKAVGPVNTYSGATMLLDFLNPVLDPRITFSRGTNATLIDSTGKLTYAPNNLLTYSEDFSNAAWTKTTTTVTANAAIAPDGTLTADQIVFASGTSEIFQAAGSGAAAIGSVWVKGTAGQTIQIYDAYTLKTPTVLTGDWQRLSVPVLGAIRYLDISAGNGSTARTIFLWGAQLEAVTYQTTPSAYNATTASAYYGPRFDYDPVTLAPRGLLIEEARTNTALHSADITNAVYIFSASSATANVTTAPDGTQTADKAVEDNTNAVHRFYQTNVVTVTSAFSASVYLKAAERSFAYFGIGNGQYTRASINLTTGATGALAGPQAANLTIRTVAAGNGWWRVIISGTFSTADSGHVWVTISDNGAESYLGNGTSGIYVWGYQGEAGSFATSYIPTVASTVTRNADVATMTGTNFSTWYNQNEGTFVVGYDQLSGENKDIFMAGSAGGSFNPGSVGIYGAGTSIAGYVRSSSAYTAQANVLASLGNNIPLSAAVAYKVNDVAASAMGATPVVATPPNAMPTTVIELKIMGAGVTGGGKSGHIRQIAYFNTRLPNAQLQTLTAPSLATTLSLDFTTGSYNVGF